ncbi:MAG: ABC transporter permease [Lachnospiraceae bacterium]|nr:ABC transporter permease [Lachnospiraceae bacterium]
MKFPGRRLSIPYALFLLFFVVLPLVIVFYYAFTDGSGQFTLENFLNFFQNPKTMGTLVYSLVIAILTTLLALVLAYPTAYILAMGYVKNPRLLLVIFITPMWINSVLRLTALKEILSAIEGNIAYYPFINTILGMTYDFLPFMILPIYNSITKIDVSLKEAALDLGASNRSVLWKVMIPLSMPGIISGITMVFLPAMTNYVVLDLMYNSTYIMGSLIGSYFNAYDWNRGAMVSAVLLLSIALLSFSEKPERKEKVKVGGVSE